MILSYEVISDVGLYRKNNEDMALVMQQTVRDDSDSFSFEIPEGDFKFAAIVCDGLGGHANGEVASEMACLSFRDFTDSLPEGLDENALVQAVKQWFRKINEEIINASPGVKMCTTLTGILIYGETALILNSGDSRTYRRRHDSMRQLTVDHSKQVKTSDSDTPSSIIYNCLGVPGAFVDVKITRVIPGDSFLVCSDGLSGMISAETMAAEFNSATTLLQSALIGGGWDNVTIIVLKFSEKKSD
ncbi:MAG: protein phosphatase 2C domain-containing protein [Muribaculaceae bacterium]|nr:protein phosphatase 2C domain-containing protein [Muribaculaceae bacterium]